MTKTIKKTRRTPAEEARARLRAQPRPEPLAVAVTAAPPGSAIAPRLIPPMLSKTTIEIMKERDESHEQQIIALKKRLDEAEGDLFRIVECLIATSSDPLYRVRLREIVTKHQGKTSK